MLHALSPDINSSTAAMLEANFANAQNLGLLVERIGGSNVVQFSALETSAVDMENKIAAGILLAKVCLGGGGEVSDCRIRRYVTVCFGLTSQYRATNPLVDCIGCQYAGWPLAARRLFGDGQRPDSVVARI